MRAEISFEMRVVRPSETVWSSSYELFCVGGKKYLDSLILETQSISKLGPNSILMGPEWPLDSKVHPVSFPKPIFFTKLRQNSGYF